MHSKLNLFHICKFAKKSIVQQNKKIENIDYKHEKWLATQTVQMKGQKQNDNK